MRRGRLGNTSAGILTRESECRKYQSSDLACSLGKVATFLPSLEAPTTIVNTSSENKYYLSLFSNRLFECVTCFLKTL
jgi:hypothetical protein